MTTKLSTALDRLSSEIDPGKHESRRYEREEGAALINAASITAGAFKDSDFTVAAFDQFGIPGTGFIIRHDGSEQVIGNLHLAINQKELRVWMEPKGNFTAAKLGQPSTVPVEAVGDEAVHDAVAEQMRRIRFLGHSS